MTPTWPKLLKQPSSRTCAGVGEPSDAPARRDSRTHGLGMAG